ncbi:F0F1 ATP synthase subunit B [Granulicatella seriolae]|uniref:ATP synthase subunit b n=1 Tax=Granulicatella seriolae TaxID=2967226 RepID=A0ABT1WL62_9LACT|nr:F0F1 ATP synthase subunit B [Granulicatella seriolae]
MLQTIALSTSASTSLGDTIFVLISFIILMALIKRFAWDKVISVMEARRDKISQDLDNAATKRKEAESVVAQASTIIQNAEDQANTILTNSREASTKMQDEMIKEAREVVTRMKLDAQKEIDNMKQRSVMELQAQVGDISIELAQQILKKEISAKEHQELITSFIEGLDVK